MGKWRTMTRSCTVKYRDIHRGESDIVDRTDLKRKGKVQLTVRQKVNASTYSSQYSGRCDRGQFCISGVDLTNGFRGNHEQIDICRRIYRGQFRDRNGRVQFCNVVRLFYRNGRRPARDCEQERMPCAVSASEGRDRRPLSSRSSCSMTSTDD